MCVVRVDCRKEGLHSFFHFSTTRKGKKKSCQDRKGEKRRKVYYFTAAESKLMNLIIKIVFLEFFIPKTLPVAKTTEREIGSSFLKPKYQQ